jgi:ribulose-5-phosphate 4-epimerase/fuculose-1-phosphate aldolase
MATVTQLRPVEISPKEWEVRCDLAALYRAFVRYGWTDLIYTHISARLPGEPTHYLINPYGLMFEEITASNLIVMDFDGNKVRGDWPVNEAGHAIHHAVLKARPDVDWVLHTHSRAGMAVACMKCGVLPITQQAMFYHGQIAYHPWDVQTSGQEECDRLAADLGDKNVAVLENHGLLACGPTAADAFLTLYNIENACKVQVDVMASGQEIIMPSEEALARTVEVGSDPAFAAADENWQAVRRVLDAKDPSYKT